MDERSSDVESSDADNEHNMYTSEEILFEMGFNNNLIKRTLCDRNIEKRIPKGNSSGLSPNASNNKMGEKEMENDESPFTLINKDNIKNIEILCQKKVEKNFFQERNTGSSSKATKYEMSSQEIDNDESAFTSLIMENIENNNSSDIIETSFHSSLLNETIDPNVIDVIQAEIANSAINPLSISITASENGGEMSSSSSKANLLHSSKMSRFQESDHSLNEDSDPDYIPSDESSNELPTEERSSMIGNEAQRNGDQEGYQTDSEKNNEMSITEEPSKIIKLRKKNNKHNWKKIDNQKKREQGNAYIGYRRTVHGKIAQDVPRAAKAIGPRCTSQSCERSKLRECSRITEKERQQIFKNFWKSMTWDQRKIYVVSLVEKSCITRKRTEAENSRRNETLKYHLVIGGKKVQVCQKTFLHTMGIKKWSVRYWLDGDGKTIPKLNNTENRIVPSSSVSHQSEKGTRKKKDQVEFLRNFLKSLPRLPSHYCRASSTKLYVEPVFESITQLFELYVEKCNSDKKTALSRYTFDKIFEEENLALFQPKKDQCDVCHSFQVKSGHITEDQYNDHILQKNRARQEKTNDTERAKSNLVHVFSQDTQAVKLAPCVNASAMYYKTKLSVHNFTMYNHSNHDAMTYWWDETHSDLSASSFASCVIDNLRNTLEVDLKPVVIWSDGCGYQNRSSIMSSALLHLAKEKGIQIEQKYLIKGHTMMECDSVHSAIDTILNPKRGSRNKKTFREIYLPSQYAQYTKEARKNPFPYKSRFLDFSFFTDYSIKDTIAYNSIRPGKKTGDPTVHDLKALRYNSNGVIEYKINFDDEYKQLPKRPKTGVSEVFKPLHVTRLKKQYFLIAHLVCFYSCYVPLNYLSAFERILSSSEAYIEN